MTRMRTRWFVGGLVATVMWWSAAPFAASGDSTQIAKGQKAYAEKKCAMCHTINDKGGKSGGDLTKVGAVRDADWLKRFTKEPKSVMPNAKMPAFKGTEEELDAIVAYMASLK
ncbi:MAG TPA: cytochrome c [Nitrospiraceae bacterium]|jgi:mono/diheme cytochrome c family protein|nr:cytochrome c [Nitrospiraceae bacterium]